MSANEMSHEWCEVSLKIDKATAVTMSRRGARGHSTKRTDGIFYRPCMRRTTTHHDAAQLSTARVGALRPMPYCLGIGSTRVGPGRTPTVHPC